MRVSAIIPFLAICFGGALHAQPTLVLEAATDRGLYRESARSVVYVEARIRTPPSLPEAGPASVRNLALVVDRSGSMAGEPMKALREALVATVALLAERDIFAIVAFGSEVETLIPAQRRDQASDVETRLAQLEPAGGAALYDALNQGAAQLRRHAGQHTINHLVLVIDGPATRGPREFDDFFRLAEVFAREGITLSTVGLGDDFDEDLLAGLARIGNGRFHYVDQPAKLRDALQADIAPLGSVIAYDAELTITFKPYFDEIDSHGWAPGTIERRSVSYRFPRLFADQDLAVLASGRVRATSATGALRDAIEVRLRWRSQDGETHESARTLTLRFVTDSSPIRDGVNASVFRTAVRTLISEGMQESIEHLDKGDFRRALRALRRTRSDARDLNVDLADEQIAASIRQLDTYLAEVEARGMNRLDRKILRSGLFSQFDPPMADEERAN